METFKNLSEHDRQILRQDCADVMDELRPMIALFPTQWVSTFEQEADRWLSIANGRKDGSDEQKQAIRYRNAHLFLIDESGLS